MKSKIWQRLPWFNLYFCLFIILWGAWVRLSGSGAGCGDHWPLCNGDVIPLSPSIKTLTELIHRLTSGIFGITIALGFFHSYKTKLENKPYFKASFYALVFTFIEALIGAVLVKKGLVVKNSSALRAVVMSLHLINTLMLIFFITQTCIFVRGKVILGNLNKPQILIYLLFFVVGASGAIAALGNTLFPETSLIDGIMKDFSPLSHFLIRLRIVHPIAAVGLFLLLLYTQTSKYVRVVAIISVAWGVVNLLLLAPNYGALIHLLLAKTLFIVFSWDEVSKRIA